MPSVAESIALAVFTKYDCLGCTTIPCSCLAQLTHMIQEVLDEGQQDLSEVSAGQVSAPVIHDTLSQGGVPACCCVPHAGSGTCTFCPIHGDRTVLLPCTPDPHYGARS